MQPPADLDAIEAGEREIEQYQIGSLTFGRRQRNKAIVHDRDNEAFAAQPIGNRNTDRRVVLDHKYVRHIDERTDHRVAVGRRACEESVQTVLMIPTAQSAYDP